jgi:hypothetical protein
MATTINADTVTGGLIATGDATGELALQSGGTTIVTVDTSGASLGDSKKILLGDGDDLQIYHDGSNSTIADNGTGALVLYGSDIIFQKSGSSERLADFAQDGAARLYYDGNIKIATTSGGVDVTGQLNADVAVIDTAAGNINLGTDAGGSISIGLKNDTSSTPYFDFNSGSTTVDYDVRIQAEGGNGTAGNGTFKIVADNARVEGEFRAYSYNETYAAVTSSSNATTVNCENGNAFSHTLTENTTFTFSNPPSSGTAYSFSIEIIQDASASGYTVTWPSSVDWPSATAPTLTATASAKDVFVFYTRDGGTNWYGFTAGQALG